jgi:hypothetical protein
MRLWRRTQIQQGMVIVLFLVAAVNAAPSQSPTGIPAGFTPLFNGKTLNGWHWSKTNHHGTNGLATVEDGAIALRQNPYGQGGLFLTDKKYRNFELYVEVKAPWGDNSGIFFRSTESGSAYQIELNPGAGTGNLIGENMRVSQGAQAADIPNIWKDDAYNSFRLRVEGDAPHITLWVNGTQMWDVQEPVNDKIAGETSGYIGLQLHWGVVYQPADASRNMNAWKPGTAYLFRNIAIKELP